MKTVLAVAALLIVSACAIDPGPVVGDSRAQCQRSCRQSVNVCTDSTASQSQTDRISRVDAVCDGQYRQCLARCGL
jgi:hypothetical protein